MSAPDGATLDEYLSAWLDQAATNPNVTRKQAAEWLMRHVVGWCIVAVEIDAEQTP